MKKLVKCYFWSLLTTLTIAILSLMPVPEIEEVKDVPLFDKWAHFVMYGGLSCAIWFDICRHRLRLSTMNIVLLTIVYPVVLGGLMELGQAYLTTCRSGDWWDFVADSIGVFIAIPIGVLMRKVRRPV